MPPRSSPTKSKTKPIMRLRQKARKMPLLLKASRRMSNPLISEQHMTEWKD